MRILITGATGLVGSSIVALCRERQIPVNYLTTDREAVTNSEDYRGFYWNPSDRQINPACFEGVSAIINLAGSPISKRWTKSRKRVILASRLDSLKTLAKGIEEAGRERLSSIVSASAIGIYPDSLSQFYTEDEAAVDESFLGEVVAAWENEADTLKKFCPRVAKVRIGLVLSADGGALPQLATPVRYYAGAAFGSGQQWQSWIHIDDLARMFLFIIDHKLEGIYNGVAPNPVTNNKLVREIAEVLGKPLVLPNIPEFLMRILLGKMADVLFASQRVSSRKIEDQGFDFNYANICRALQNLYGKGGEDASGSFSPGNRYFS